MSFYHITILS